MYMWQKLGLPSSAMFSNVYSPHSLFLGLILSLTLQATAIKFVLPANKYPLAKCIWNTAHENELVIVTANVGPGAKQRVDIEIVDSSPNKNVYLSKKDIKQETRLAITTHAEGEVGVCFKNHLDKSELTVFHALVEVLCVCVF